MTLQKVNFYYENIKKAASKLYVNCLSGGGEANYGKRGSFADEL